VSVDEVKDIRNVAVAMAAYAKQAKNRDLEANAAELRMRATRRLAQMIEAQKQTVGLSAGTRGSRKKGARVDEKPTLASQGIDKNLAHHARVLGALSDAKFEEVVTDARDEVTRAVQKVVRAHSLQSKDDQIKAEFHKVTAHIPPNVHGDFRTSAHVIPDNSVELVLIQHYCHQASLYEDIAKVAMRILKPGGSLVCYVDHAIFPEAIELIARHLKYFWIGCIRHSGPPVRVQEHGISTMSTPVLWFVKGHRGDRQKFVSDTVSDKQLEARHFIKNLTSENGTVIDLLASDLSVPIAAQKLGRPWASFNAR
jgi:hypothetical protein